MVVEAGRWVGVAIIIGNMGHMALGIPGGLKPAHAQVLSLSTTSCYSEVVEVGSAVSSSPLCLPVKQMESEEDEVIGRPRRRKSIRTFKFNSSDDESVLQTDVERISSFMSVSKNNIKIKTGKPIPAPRVTGRKDGGALASERASPSLDVGARTSSVSSGRVGGAVGVSCGSPARASGNEREETVVRAPPASYALAVRARSPLPMATQVAGVSETLRAMDARASTYGWRETSMPLPQSKRAVVACGVSPSLIPACKVNAPVTLGWGCTRISPASTTSTGSGCGTPATQVSRSSTISAYWCDIMDGDARRVSSVVDGGASGARAGASTPAVAPDVATSTSRALVSTEVEPIKVPEIPRFPRRGATGLVLKRKSRGGGSSLDLLTPNVVSFIGGREFRHGWWEKETHNHRACPHPWRDWACRCACTGQRRVGCCAALGGPLYSSCRHLEEEGRRDDAGDDRLLSR